AEHPSVPRSECPVCGTPVERPEGEVMVYCPNGSCPARIFWGLVHFVSQHAMDIRGLGERTADQLLRTGLVRDYADLYHLTAEQLLTLDGFGAVSAGNLLSSIEASKQRPPSNLLSTLEIRHVRQHSDQLLAKRFVHID